MIESDYPCQRCGCTGIHACIGHVPEPLTQEQEESLNAFFKNLFESQEELDPEMAKILNDNISELYLE